MLRPRELPLPFSGDSADHVVERSCPGPAVLEASPKWGLTRCVRDGGYRKVTWDVLAGRLTGLGALLPEQSLVWPPEWVEFGFLSQWQRFWVLKFLWNLL